MQLRQVSEVVRVTDPDAEAIAAKITAGYDLFAVAPHGNSASAHWIWVKYVARADTH